MLSPSYVPPIILPWYPSDLFQVRNLQQKEMITTELWPREQGGRAEWEVSWARERLMNQPLFQRPYWDTDNNASILLDCALISWAYLHIVITFKFRVKANPDQNIYISPQTTIHFPITWDLFPWSPYCPNL